MAKKNNKFKQLLVVGGTLAILQVAFIAFMGGFTEKKKSVKTIINSTVNNADHVKLEDKARVKVQLALGDYRRQNGKYPSTLSQLVPTYFDSTPIDPETGEVFRYEVRGVGYRIGKVRKSVSAVAAMMRAKGGGELDPENEKLSESDQDMFLAMLDQDMKDQDYVYDPAGKRDPFRSYDFSPRKTGKKGNTPLECCDYSDLRIVAVLNFGSPKASIETPDGQGHLASIGDKVGVYGGKIVKIEDDKVTILETTENFSGEKETRTVEMFLR